jgi:hypothetical protein
MGLHAGETSLVTSIDTFPAVTPKRRPTSRCGSPGRSRTARNSMELGRRRRALHLFAQRRERQSTAVC